MPDVLIFQGGELDNTLTHKVTLLLRALSSKLVFRIMELLADGQKLTVTEIYSSLGIQQSVVSRHLGILKKHNVVFASKMSTKIFYSLNPETIRLINLAVESFVS